MEDNEFTLISSTICTTPQRLNPLTSKRSMNSLNSPLQKESPKSPSKSSRSSPIRQRPESSPTKLTVSNNESSPSKLSYIRLERQYTDLVLKYNNLTNDYHQLELNLSSKLSLIEESKLKNKKLESYIKLIQDEYNENKTLLTQEIKLYEQTILELQVKIKKLNLELQAKENNDEPYCSINQDQYDKLAHDHKILQTNFELEQCSKTFLMDQIELLSKENDQLKSNSHALTDSHSKSFGQDSDSSVIHYVTEPNIEHTMNDLTDEDLSNDTNGSIEHISNISTQQNILSNLDSFQISSDFRFPPSPDPESKLKRQSLPAQLKDEFILSPLKLAGNNHLYFEVDENTSPKIVKRYSKGHSRYNSYDIVPIKVEFEPMEVRSTSVPEHQLQKTFIEEEREYDDIQEEEEPEERTHAYKALIGEVNSAPTTSSSMTRNSIIGEAASRNSLFSSSSKRSSMIEDPIMSKQEIMKLKFELQSLRLHNEKLLSYIGFELQKQKVNLEELTKNMEYSDSKLIEKSREELIHKKRVLRSVSINPILSKKYNNHDNPSILGKGILSNYIFDEEDDYGFLNHNDQYSKRIFSRGLHLYFNDDEPGEEEHVNKSLKNHKSLKNLHYNYDEIDDDEYEEEIDETQESCEDETSSDEEIGIIKQFKHMILRGSKKKYMKNKEELVDDQLKYKFIAITLGIMIIGLRFSHQNIQG